MIKRYYAYLQIKQMIKLGRSSSQDRLERAKKMSLANNFVTPLTSLVVVVDNTDTPTTPYNPFSQPSYLQPSIPSMPSHKFSRLTYANFHNIDSGQTNSPVRKSEIIEIDETTDVEDPDTCKITLYSERLYTGESVTLKNDATDLSKYNFDEMLVSVRVEGPCSWRIYQGEERTVTSS